MTMSSLSQVGWLSLMLSLASKATAFHSSSREPLAMLHRETSRDTATKSYSHSRLPKKSLPSTRLQYRDGREDPSTLKTTTESTGWWNNLFHSSDSHNEQDSVDEYLEFLEKRYNRLHEESEGKPFSAINWLLQGSGSSEEAPVSEQQKEDALYVLGVAGLASQKLLQKHPHLLNENDKEDSRMEDFKPASVDTLDVIPTSAEALTFGHMVIKRVLVPIVKVLYLVNRRKQIFMNSQWRRAKAIVNKTSKSVLRSLFCGPMKIAKAFMEFGGGKENIISTIAFVSTVFVLARPVFQNALTDGSVGP